MNHFLLSPAIDDRWSKSEVIHGVEVRDPFRWLEDQDAPSTRRFLQEQESRLDSYLASYPGLLKRIKRDIKALVTAEDVALPIPDNRGGLLYMKRPNGAQRSSVYRQDSLGHEECLITVEMLEMNAERSLTLVQSSPSGRYVVFGVREGGEDVIEFGVFDIDMKRLLPDRFSRGFPRGLMFDEAETGFYYVQEDLEGVYKSRRVVRRHLLSESQTSDVEIFEVSSHLNLRLILVSSTDRKHLGYLCVTLGRDSRTRFLLHTLQGDEPIKEIADLKDAVFSPHISERYIDVYTTLGAPNGKVLRIPILTPSRDKWVELIPEKQEPILRLETAGDLIVVHYRIGPTIRGSLFSALEPCPHILEYPRNGTVSLGPTWFPEHRLFYLHSDVNLPPTIYKRDLLTGVDTLWWQQKVPFSLPHVTCERMMSKSKDGTDVPLTLIHRSDRVAPFRTLLTAYGASGISITPQFSIFMTVLLKLGFQCVLAHVRGGGEGGSEWRMAGQGQRKQTSVDDFIGAAQGLIAEGLAGKGTLAGCGQSGGSVVILSSIMQEPQLLRAAVVLGPLADMVRFHRFGVASGFTAEFGSPDNPEDFPYLLKLSPYHAVRDGVSYPSLLVISGDRDKRCDALHARKIVARLQQATRGNNSVLLDYHPQRGHKPALTTDVRVAALSNRIAFLCVELSRSRATKERRV